MNNTTGGSEPMAHATGSTPQVAVQPGPQTVNVSGNSGGTATSTSLQPHGAHSSQSNTGAVTTNANGAKPQEALTPASAATALPVSVVGAPVSNAWSGSTKGHAHRGDSKNRAEDRQCHNCGVFGHLARHCRKGGASGQSQLEKSVQDMKERSDGDRIALGDQQKVIREVTAELTQAQQAVGNLEKQVKTLDAELRNIKTAAEVDAQLRAVQMDFVIQERPISQASWKLGLVRALLVFVWSISLYFWNVSMIYAMVFHTYLAMWCVRIAHGPTGWRVPMAVWWAWFISLARLEPTTASAVGVLSVASFWYYYNAGCDDSQCKHGSGINKLFWASSIIKGLRVKTESLVDDNGLDMRPDANSLMTLKHAKGLIGRVLMLDERLGENDPKREKRLLVSFEMIAQLSAPKYMTFAADDKTALARMVRAAETIQLVNFNRYDVFAARSIPMNSALVSWALWRRQQENGLLDFTGAPQL